MTYQPKRAQRLSHYIKCEVHGEWGGGKSRFASTFPGPKLWIDPMHGCDNYVVTEGDTPDYHETSQNPETIFAALAWAEGACREGLIKTVVVDDATILQNQMVYAAAGEGKPTLDQWGPLKRPIARAMTRLSGSPVHIVITSRASMIAAEESGGKIVSVHKAARPKAWDDFLYVVDYALFLYDKGSELAPEKIRFFASVQKTRAAQLPMGRIIEDPSFERVFADILAQEAGAPLAEYDDIDAAVGAQPRPTMDRLAKEQVYEELARAIQEAESADALKGAWTRASTAKAEFSQVKWDALFAMKDKRKAELGVR